MVFMVGPAAEKEATSLLPRRLSQWLLREDGGLTADGGTAEFRLSGGCEAGRVMDSRYVFSVLAGVFCVALIFAVVATARHISNRADYVVFRQN
jgi:hypothetical protein